MKVKLNSFPQVHFTTWCEVHKCKVSSRIDVLGTSGGATITPFQCETGGIAVYGSCDSYWVLNLLSPGGVTIDA